MLHVATHGNDRAKLLGPLDLVLHVEAGLRVCEVIRLRGRGQCVAGGGIGFVDPNAILRLVKAVVNPVVADLQAERVLYLAAEPSAEDGMAGIQSATQRLSFCSN